MNRPFTLFPLDLEASSCYSWPLSLERVYFGYFFMFSAVLCHREYMNRPLAVNFKIAERA